MTRQAEFDAVVRAMRPGDWPVVERAFSHGRLGFRNGAVWRWLYQRQDDGMGPWCACLAATSDAQVHAFVGGVLLKVWFQGAAYPLVLVPDGVVREDPAATSSATGPSDLAAGVGRHFVQQARAHADWALAIHEARFVAGPDAPANAVLLETLSLRVDPAAASGGATCLLQTEDFAQKSWQAWWSWRQQHLTAGLVKDHARLAWRYGRQAPQRLECLAIHSIAFDHPIGYLVIQAISREEVLLVDLALPPASNVARDALAQLLALLAERGVRLVRAGLSQACPEYRLMLAFGFERHEASQALASGSLVALAGGSPLAPSQSLALTIGDCKLE